MDEITELAPMARKILNSIKEGAKASKKARDSMTSEYKLIANIFTHLCAQT